MGLMLRNNILQYKGFNIEIVELRFYLVKEFEVLIVDSPIRELILSNISNLF